MRFVRRCGRVGRAEREERRGIDQTRAARARRPDRVSQTADVDVIEVLPSRAPDLHHRRGVDDGAAAFGRPHKTFRIAHVTVSHVDVFGESGASAASHEEHWLVAARHQGTNDAATEEPSASGHEHSHVCRASIL